MASQLKPTAAERHAAAVAEVVSTYKLTTVYDGPNYTSILVSHPTDESRSYRVTKSGGVWKCTCGAFSRSGESCKHLESLSEREDWGKPARSYPAPIGKQVRQQFTNETW